MIEILKIAYRSGRSISARLRRLLDYLLWSRWPETAGAHCVGKVRCIGRPRIRIAPGARIRFGDDVFLASRSDANPLQLAHPCSLTAMSGAEIYIGTGTAMSGVVIVAETQIEIGKNVMIGANVTIIDTDFHPLNAAQRREHPTEGRKTKPVKIGNDVFIGTGAIILKGTEIGDECVVGAGSVVAGHFPPKSVVAGNPARVIVSLNNKENERRTPQQT